METHPKTETVKLLQVVMAHKQAQATFDRHARFWAHHDCDTLVFCPKGDEVVSPWPTISMGSRQHHGPMANKRFKWLIHFLAKLDYQWFLVQEYDSFCVSPVVPIVSDQRIRQAMVVAGNVFTDNRPDRGFVGQTFIHPPLVISKSALIEVDKVMDKVPEWAEEGFWDRLLGFVIEQADIMPVDMLHLNLGFAKNTITQKDHPELVKAICGGVRFIHGVKDPLTFEVIMQATATTVPNLT